MSPTRLRVEAVEAGYGPVQVLHRVSLDVLSGETVAVLGRNGAGKSTLLRVIMGLLRPWRGRIELDGQALDRLEPHRIPRAGLAYVPQGRRLFPLLTVEENLRMGLLAGGQGPATRDRVLALFPPLRDRLAQRAGTLSGGEQQMLATARALCAGPRILLLDEPTEGLMPALVTGLLDTLRRLRAEGVGVLLVEQHLDAALAVADRVVVLDRGRVVLAATPDALAADPDMLVRHLGVRR